LSLFTVFVTGMFYALSASQETCVRGGEERKTEGEQQESGGEIQTEAESDGRGDTGGQSHDCNY